MSTTYQILPAPYTATQTDQIDLTLKSTMYLMMEDGTSKLLMEDASGSILLENSYSAPTVTNQIP
jgi:hypothetical protein